MKLHDSPKWPGDPRSKLGERLRRLRLDEGWTQKELAERLHTGPTLVCDWEKGTRCPSLPSLVRYASLLDMTVSDILYEVL